MFAFVGLLAGVQSHVRFEVVVAGKFFVTSGTLEGLLPGVRSLVVLQHVLVVEGAFASRANVLSDSLAGWFEVVVVVVIVVAGDFTGRRRRGGHWWRNERISPLATAGDCGVVVGFPDDLVAGRDDVSGFGVLDVRVRRPTLREEFRSTYESLPG